MVKASKMVENIKFIRQNSANENTGTLQEVYFALVDGMLPCQNHCYRSIQYTYVPPLAPPQIRGGYHQEPFPASLDPLATGGTLLYLVVSLPLLFGFLVLLLSMVIQPSLDGKVLQLVG